jgi:hypothetical protein
MPRVQDAPERPTYSPLSSPLTEKRGRLILAARDKFPQ